MLRSKTYVLDSVALVLVVLATSFQLLGFFSPSWWEYEMISEGKLVKRQEVGMLSSVTCRRDICAESAAMDIEGGREWLFLTRVFEVFGVAGVVLSLLLQVIYCPIQKPIIRSASIYSLVAAGLFSISGALVFFALHKTLMGTHAKGEQTFQYPSVMCLLGGILAIVAASVTAVATLKRARLREAFESDED